VGNERLDRLARIYAGQTYGQVVPWAQWEQERDAALRFLRSTPLALAEFHAVVTRYHMDDPRPLLLGRWLEFCAAMAKAIRPHCDAEKLADVIAASREGKTA
jgi:hypothetical protein